MSAANPEGGAMDGPSNPSPPAKYKESYPRGGFFFNHLQTAGLRLDNI